MEKKRIKEYNEMQKYLIEKDKKFISLNKVATPFQRLKYRLGKFILKDRFVALTVYVICFVLTILFSIKF